jgi:hypothetical protein
LDIKKKKPAAEVAASPIEGDTKDIQYLLNAFLILNVAQFCALVALRRLHRKQKQAESRRSSALLPPIYEDEDDATPAQTPDLRKEADEWNEDPAVPAVDTKSHSGTIRSLRGIAAPSSSTATEQSIPLLRPPSQASSNRSSRYLTVPGLTSSSSHGRVLRTKSELKRGRVFAVLCGMMIAFAWVLFMGVAYLRLRSKEERSANGSMH